jgi:hypothetical protein
MAPACTQIALPAELHPFVIMVLGDPHLQLRLAPIAETDAFIKEALIVATENGVALDPISLSAILRPGPLGLGRFASAPIICDAWPPVGWLPTRSVPSGGAPAFDWLWFGAQRLLRPFMEDDVRNAGSLPFNWLFRIRTSLEAVVAGAKAEPHIPLSGLVFHMSRCGSTLLAQMLAAVPEHIVSSEPEPLDGVIQWARMAQVGDEAAIRAMRAIVAALGRDRENGALHHIIKVDAWHAFSLPLFRAAFPAVNWIHLYRDATEVMVSTMQQPGLHTAPGGLPQSVIGFAFDAGMSLEDFAARVLAGIGDAILTHWDLGGGRLVAYPEIVKASTDDVAAHFKLDLDASSVARMTAAAKRDAKDPQQGFASDVLRKQAATTRAIADAVTQWLQPVEDALDMRSKLISSAAKTGLQSQLND